MNEALCGLMNGPRRRRRAERALCAVGLELRAACAQLDESVKGRMTHTAIEHERVRRVRLEAAPDAERAPL